MTDRVIRTIRYEGLARIPIIREFGHLCSICYELVHWYNTYRPHMTLNGFTPDDFYRRDYPEPVPRDAKTVPIDVERRVFKHTCITGYRLKYAA